MYLAQLRKDVIMNVMRIYDHDSGSVRIGFSSGIPEGDVVEEMADFFDRDITPIKPGIGSDCDIEFDIVPPPDPETITALSEHLAGTLGEIMVHNYTEETPLCAVS